ncbi:MAG TPA: AI-2E family transporter [Longimicrobiaceae bacterium]|nr:AI-2E family transporter [Longimicrobiaceae bacterium]
MYDSQTTPAASAAEGLSWRTIHAVAVVFVLALFLFSLRTLLNPFILFLLFLFLVSPSRGSRHYVLLVSATGILTLVWLLETTGFLLAPFFLALVLAYIQHPLVSVLERRGLSRTLAVFLLAVPALVAIVLVAVVGIPALGEQVAGFIANVPGYLQAFTLQVERWQVMLQRRDLPYLDEEAVLARLRAVQPEAVMAYLQDRQAQLARAAWQGVLGVGRGVSSVLSLLSYVFLTPILTFYLLRDWGHLQGSLTGLVPAAQQGHVLGFFREYDRLLSGYLRGQFLAAAIVGVLTWLGFWILDFPYALLLGVVAGVFNVIPYMGLVASLIPALIIALFSGSVLLGLGKIALVFAVVQVLDGSVIGPKIVGEAVGLHPVWVILALAVSGYFFGFVGLIIAVPLAVLVKLLLASALARYRGSALFQGGAKLATGEPVGPEARPAGAEA